MWSVRLTGILMFVAISGCGTHQKNDTLDFGTGAPPARIPELLPLGTAHQAPGTFRSPQELRAFHNSRVARIHSLTMHGDVQAEWSGLEGERHRDAGMAMVCYRRPADTAMTYYVAGGEPILWAGSNSNFYWGINSHDDVAFLGRTMNVKGPFEEKSPVMLHPVDFITALGLTEIPADAEIRKPPAILQGADGKDDPQLSFVVKGQRVDQILTLDTQEGLIRTVEVVDHSGITLGICRLGSYKPVKAVSGSPVPEPLAASELLIESIAMQTRVTIRATYLGEAPSGHATYRDTVFDFPFTVKSLGITRVLVLDADSKLPAMTPSDVHELLPGVRLLKSLEELRRK